MKTKARKIAPPSCMQLWCVEACRRLSLALILMVLCSVGAWAQSNNSCGDGLTYTLSNGNKTLTISKTGEGTGAMTEYQSSSNYPWYSFKDIITTVVINEGVTSIGNRAFSDFDHLPSVTIGSSVTNIGDYAFYDCDALTSVTFSNSVTSIGDYAFANCGLTSLTIPNSVTTIDNNAFQHCIDLTTVTIGSGVTSMCGPFTECTSVTDVYCYANPANLNWLYGNTDFQSSTTSNKPTCYVINVSDWASFSSLNVTFGEMAPSYQGYCGVSTVHEGQDVSWKLYGNGLLMINGTGAMADYDDPENVPWNGKNISISSVEIGSDVTSIGSYAFMDCGGLTSITIPNSVTSIGRNAFYICSNLATITIPDGVESIGSSAFDETPWKTTWLNNQPDGVVYIGKVAYTYKGTMPENSDIALAANTKGIAGGAFMNQGNLASITIPDGVTNIGNSAFYNCSNLTTIAVDNDNANYSSADGVLFNKAKTTLITCPQGKTGSYTIPNSVTIIDNSAFYGCSNLTSVIIPNTVTTIGEWVFENCSGLESIFIPSSVTSIGSGAFYTFHASTSVYVMATTPPTLGDYAFNSVPYPPTIYVPSGSEDIYKAAENWSDYASKIEVLSITDLGNCGSPTLTDVTWTLYDNGMLIISGTGAMADYGYDLPWPNASKVVIGDGVTSIGVRAFLSCKNLSSVTLPNSVTSIGSAAFQGCTALTTISIPNGLESIGYAAFDNTAWKSNLPSGMVYLGKVAYIYKGTMPSNTEINLNEGTISIAGGAFDFQSNLKSVTIPNSVTNIGSGAFSYCTGLTSVAIPSSVTNIEELPFYRCFNLTTILVDENNANYASVDGVLFNKAKTTLITCPEGKSESFAIPNSVKSIGNDAFNGCNKLTSVTIPNSVTNIGGNAFYGCDNLTSITIPHSVTSIGNEAFGACFYINDVYCYADPTKLLWTMDEYFGDFKSEKETKFHVTKESAWSKANNTDPYYYLGQRVNFVEDLISVTPVGDYYWATFYTPNDEDDHGKKYQVDANTTIYKASIATEDPKVIVTAVGGNNVIPAGTAVILKSTGIPLLMTETNEVSTGNYSGNALLGSDGNVNTDAKRIYCLAYMNNKLAFYKVQGGVPVPAGKAYLHLDAGARKFYDIEEGGTTAIENIEVGKDDNIYYDLQGRRVLYPSKGLYIIRSAKGDLQGKNGKKVIIK